MNDFEDRDLGVGRSRMSDFTAQLRSSMDIISMSDEERAEICNKLSEADGGDYDPVALFNAARKPLCIVGDPGIGKTMGIISLVNEYNQKAGYKKWGLKKILLGQTIVGSLQGIPVVDTTTHKVIRANVPDFPYTRENAPEDTLDEDLDPEYGILFLDEITTADTAQVQPALGLCDDSRCIGTYTLPKNWIVVGAGNSPRDANFVEMKTMLTSRFILFDVNIDYQKDWRPWARNNGIDPLIIAFLNFKPENICVVKNDFDSDGNVGKQTANPRTWERLSGALKGRKMVNRPVGDNELYAFASRIIGIDTAREFSAFAAFRSKITVHPADIINGTASYPKEAMPEEQFHILMQGLLSGLRTLSKRESLTSGYSDDTVTKVANVMSWIIELGKYCLESVINTVKEIQNELPDLAPIFLEDSFTAKCPSYDEFISEYYESIADIDFDAF